jgi:serine/threonine protein kinase
LLREDGYVKIADFGISKMLSKSSQQLADIAGTPAFMAPELCSASSSSSFSGQAADIWAIGATTYMLRFGYPPFVAKSLIHLYTKIVNDPVVFPFAIDPGLQNLLENILIKDPERRFTMEQIVAHPWFQTKPKLPSAAASTAATLGGSGDGNYGHGYGGPANGQKPIAGRSGRESEFKCYYLDLMILLLIIKYYY